MALNRAFLKQRWPKKHKYVVQQCRAVNAHDLLNAKAGIYPPEWKEMLPSGVKLVVRRAGCVKRHYIQCPKCLRPCENLFLPPPEARPREWACRRCNSLVYASQRCGRGKRNILSRIDSPRKTTSRILHPDRYECSVYPEWYPTDRREEWKYIQAKWASYFRPELDPDRKLPYWLRSTT
jgi:hypothetical protein